MVQNIMAGREVVGDRTAASSTLCRGDGLNLISGADMSGQGPRQPIGRGGFGFLSKDGGGHVTGIPKDAATSPQPRGGPRE